MKLIISLIVIQLSCCISIAAQLQIKSGGTVSVKGAATIQFRNTGLENDGNFNPGSGMVIFTGDAPSESTLISGDSISAFHDLIIDKDNNGVMLDAHIEIKNTLGFSNGSLYISNFDVDLGQSGALVGESSFNRVISDEDGVVRAIREVKSSEEEHFGNLGLFITSEENLGRCTVERGHKSLNIGNTTTIDRYFYFSPEIDEESGMSVQKDYFESDIEGRDKSSLQFYQKIGSDWLTQSNPIHDTLFNSFFSEAIATESFLSLASENALTTSIQERKPEQLKIWPNPATEIINIDLGQSFRIGQYLIIRNLNGQLMRMVNINDQIIKINRNGLPPGSYFLEWKSGASTLGVGKVIWH